MSPEQANGQPTDHRTDLFSLGAVLYFMATGHPPFRADRAMGVLHRVCCDRQKPLWQVADDIPDELSVLVDRRLEKRPAKRLASADELRQQLAKLLSESQQSRRGLRRRVRRWTLRYPKRSIAAATLFAGALTTMAVQFWSPTQRDAHQATARFNVTEQPELTEQPVVRESAANPNGARVPDADSLAMELGELRARLDKLTEPVAFDSGPVDTESLTLRSLDERLDRLHGSLDFESPFTLENQNGTKGK